MFLKSTQDQGSIYFMPIISTQKYFVHGTGSVQSSDFVVQSLQFLQLPLGRV